VVEALRDYSRQHSREGYRKAHAKAKFPAGTGPINHKRIERLWRISGLTVPRKKRKRRRGKSTCPRPPVPRYPNHVWTYDFMEDSCVGGRKLRFLTVTDEFTRESLTVEVRRSFPARKVIATLSWLFVEYGTPVYLRSDNGPEFIARALQSWLERCGVGTSYIEGGKPWQNGLAESFNGRFREECLDMEIFYGLKDARMITERWRRYYNSERPHGSLGYKAPLEFKRSWMERYAGAPPPHPRSLTPGGPKQAKNTARGNEKGAVTEDQLPPAPGPAAALGSHSCVALSSGRVEEEYSEPSLTARKNG
jgi:transposase InsO family protein